MTIQKINKMNRQNGNNNKLQIRNSTAEFLVFTKQNGEDGIEVRVQNGNVWLTQKAMAALFDVQIPAVSKHLKNIFQAGELDEKVVISILETTTEHGAIEGKIQTQQTQFYNLDAIISVGYRVNSVRATAFRQWATGILRDFALRGYVIDRKRMENKTLLNGLDSNFINFLNTEQRLTSSNSPSSFDAITTSPQHPIQHLYVDDENEKDLSTYFHQAFGVDLIVDRGVGNTIPLFAGNKPSIEQREDRVSKSYRERLTILPRLQEQGDGMRSFSGILLDTFTSHYTITLIDEPEAFFNGGSYTAFNEIDSICKTGGLFIVPVGELEYFYKPNANHGTKWVNEVLEQVDLKNDAELRDAREFVESIINY
jgi:hypothetical protein